LLTPYLDLLQKLRVLPVEVVRLLAGSGNRAPDSIKLALCKLQFVLDTFGVDVLIFQAGVGVGGGREWSSPVGKLPAQASGADLPAEGHPHQQGGDCQ